MLPPSIAPEGSLRPPGRPCLPPRPPSPMSVLPCSPHVHVDHPSLQCSRNGSRSTSIPCMRLPASPDPLLTPQPTTPQPRYSLLGSLPLPLHILASSFSYSPSFIAPLSRCPSTLIFLSSTSHHPLHPAPRLVFFASLLSQLHSLTSPIYPMSSLLTSIPRTNAVQPAQRALALTLPAPYRGPMLLPTRSRHAGESFLFLVVLTLYSRRRPSRAHSSTTKVLGSALPPCEVPRMPSPPRSFPTSGPPSILRKTSLVLLPGRTNAMPLPRFPLRPLSAVAHPHTLFGNHHTTHVYPTLHTISLLQLSGLVLLSSASSSRVM